MYTEKQPLSLVGARVEDDLSAEDVAAYSQAVMSGATINEFHVLVSTVTVGDASIQLKRRPTYGSASGEVVLATVVVPGGTAAGKMLVKRFKGVDVEPGDEIVYEVISAATSGGALYDQRSDNDPEAPGEQADVIESA